MSTLFTPRLAGAVLAITVAAASAVALAADAGKKGTNAGPAAKTPSESAAAVETLALADELALYGIRQNDPVAIIQAAKMMKSVPPRTLDAKKASEGKGQQASTGKATGVDLSADALLTRAEGMAAGNATLAGLIKDARATKSRGAARGPQVARSSVLAGYTDIYTVTFRGGEQAAVLVDGDGDTDLDLYVTDENGYQICSDTDGSDTMLCRWTPAWTGPFQIRVKNLGRVYNTYNLATN